MSSVIGSVSGVSNNTAAGSSGLNYRGSSANVLNPSTIDQANQLYGQAQTGIQNQANFLQAVQAQNGLGNQNAVFGQLQGVANGTGPNPAQAQLAQATGANVANQAAMAAGQRGAGANVGLMQRQAAQQGAGIQQNAAGQAASLQAQQSLNALNQMGGLATNQANQQANAVGAYTGATQGEQGQILGSINGQNNANVGMTSNLNTGQAQLAQTAAQGQEGLLGQLAGGVGSAFHLAEGGKIPSGSAQKAPTMYAYGTTEIQAPAGGGPQSSVGKFFHGISASAPQPTPQAPAPANGAPKDFASGVAQGAAAASGIKGIYNKIHDYFNPDPNSMSNIGAPLQNMDYQVGQGPLGLGSSDVSAIPQGPTANSFTSPTLGAPPTAPQSILDMPELAPAKTELTSALGGGAGEAAAAGEAAEAAEDVEDVGEAASLLANGGTVPALMSPGEQYLEPKDVKKVAKGANPLAVGERIPGKPKYPGNDYRNDVVPKNAKAGGLVIPNEIMQSKNPHWAAKKFVEAHMAKSAGRGLVPKLGKKK